MTVAATPIASSKTPAVGRHYTPDWLARRVVDGSLAAAEHPPALILDPSCGDGAFLIAAFELLGGRECRTATERLELVRRRLFGIDIDSDALRHARKRLMAAIDAPQRHADAVDAVLRANIRCGDALTGRDFTANPRAGGAEVLEDHPRPLDWSAAFPEAAAAGGFDLVVGNPPYLRERGARELFARVAATPLGRWREARMDLWHYFVHRGLDLLRPGGRLAFVVNSYWTAATAARKLKDRLRRETTIEEILLLDDRPVFRGVTGRHMVFRLRRTLMDEPCRVVDLSQTQPTGGAPRREPLRLIPQHELFRGNQLVLSPADAGLWELPAASHLGDHFVVRQGIAENPPTIGARVARESDGRYRTGEGVFVLGEQELEDLQLGEVERVVLRRYVPTAAIARYRLEPHAARVILYLTSRTAPTLDPFPRIARHLERFRPLLERRREVRSGAIAWWHLHWPREERLFREPRILAPQMGSAPRFCWVEQPACVGFSTNVIVAGQDGGWDLRALSAILNSPLARRWFERHAKRRGAALDISGTVLRRFPLPPHDGAAEAALVQEVKVLQAGGVSASVLAEREAAIAEIVYRLYGVADAPGD